MTAWKEQHPQKTESLIAAGLIIEGKIQGAGNVRIAARVQGDVQVEGDLTVEPGAHITGEIRVDNITIGGEVHGNIVANSRVELLPSGVLVGDLKAASLKVAAGSHMRGKVEFGRDERGTGMVTIIEEREVD